MQSLNVCECKWKDEDYKVVRRNARQHHRKTGHKVLVETAYAYAIGEKEKQ
jgi:hypothetical protein